MILEIEFLCMICTMIVPSAVSTPIFRNNPFLQLLQSRLQFANEIAMLLLCLSSWIWMSPRIHLAVHRSRFLK